MKAPSAARHHAHIATPHEAEELSLHQWEVRKNLESLQAIPTTLWHGPSRWAAVAMACFGFDIYAYRPAGASEFTWVIWLGPTEEAVRAGADGRSYLSDWQVKWKAIYRDRIRKLS